MEIVTRLLLKTNEFDANLKGAKKSVSGFTNELSSISSKVLPGIAAFAGISFAIGDTVKTTMEFEKSLSSLKALTGVSTQELSFFKEESIRLGSTTTQTAAQVVDAYKLIGSQMPELLKNKEALSRITEQAIVLAEAAEIDVPTAAKALTGSLNQMGESSMYASSYINILAAASQQGSADIPYLNKAIENAGGTASAVGIKFNQLVAAVEAIAPKISDAGSAGTNLRNIFLTLEASADKNLRPSVVGLSAALENLSAKKLNATQMAKMFGSESVTAAMALVKEKDTYRELEGAITDTNTAYEQQKTNNDNLAGSIKGIQSAWEGFILTINQSSGALKDTVNIFTEALIQARRLMLTREQLMNMDYSQESKTDVDELNRRVAKRVNNGETKDQALKNEQANINRVYPEASAYPVRKEAYDKAQAAYEQKKLTNINGYAREEAQAVGEARKLFELSEREYFMRNAVLQAIEDQRKEEQIIAEATASRVTATGGELTEAEREKARREAEKKREKEFKKNEVDWNNQGWAKQEALGGTQFKQPLEQPLKIKPLPITIEEITDEALPNTDLEIKLKAKLENYEFAKKKIGELKDLMERTTDKKEKKQLKGQIGEWEKFGGIVDSKGIEMNKEYMESLQGIGDVMGNISGLFDESTGSILQWGANLLTTIGQAIPAITALIPVKKLDTQVTNENTVAETGNAVSKAVSAHAGIPFAGVALGIAAAASILAVMASVPEFENGGIVGGNSFSGDKILARINSGEMILNQGQQGNLFNLLNSGGSGVETRIAVDNIVIKGSDMHLALKTYEKRIKKI